MNPTSHELALALGPCADQEHDLIERSEGGLDPARADNLQQHLQHCARCRAYAAALAELDTALAAALPRPQLSTGFDARLEARLAELRRTPDRAAALAAAEQDHERMLLGLGRKFGWRTVLNAAALASVAGGVVLGLNAFAPSLLQASGLLPQGLSASTAFSLVLGAACLIGGFSFASRVTAGPVLRRG
jgi:anti-sigma factor RsiW